MENEPWKNITSGKSSLGPSNSDEHSSENGNSEKNNSEKDNLNSGNSNSDNLNQDKNIYGNVFHRNICWQRSYTQADGEELIMALYGSLRNGLYNNLRFNLPECSEFLGTTRISGYALYPLGAYPAVYPSKDSSVIAEVRRFSGKKQLKTAKSIDYMELFGGYHREYVDLEIEKKKIRGFIYVYDENPETEKIEHGDWVEYVKERDKEG